MHKNRTTKLSIQKVLQNFLTEFKKNSNEGCVAKHMNRFKRIIQLRILYTYFKDRKKEYFKKRRH